jgi:hypothetical protein
MNDTISFEIKGLSEAVGEMQRLSLGLGGSAAESGVMRALGRSMGFDPNALGASLQQNSLQGLGIEAASRMGLPMRPFEIGSATNRADLLIRAIDGLRKTFEKEGMGGAIRDARNLGIEALLPVLYLQKSQLDALKRDAASGGGMFSFETLARAQQLNWEMTRLNLAWSDLSTSIGVRFIPALQKITSFFTWLTNIFTSIANSRLFNTYTQQYMRNGGNQSLDENTKATNENTAAMKFGYFGGGSRFRNGIPAAFQGQGGQRLNEYLQAGSIQFGAYSIGMG